MGKWEGSLRPDRLTGEGVMIPTLNPTPGEPREILLYRYIEGLTDGQWRRSKYYRKASGRRPALGERDSKEAETTGVPLRRSR